MDVLTQGLLGGILAQAVARKDEKKLATVAGVFAGLLADADILIRSSSDPLLNIEYHRHFTHSLLFVPFGAAIALILLWPFMRRHVTVSRLYVFCLAGFSMSGVLDACTSYGTHLFWPFSDERVAFNIISIIDPVFTLILLMTLILGLRVKSKHIAHWGLAFCVAYLLLGYVQLQRAQQAAEELVSIRGHLAIQHVIKPTLANLVLWRSVYIHDNIIYVDAIRIGLFGQSRVFEGDSVDKFARERNMPGLDEASTLYTDIQRFTTFSDGYIAFDPSQADVLGDMRYSMLPTSTKPLWGIRVDTEQPQRHADYLFFRDNSPAVRQTFLDLLFGRCASEECF